MTCWTDALPRPVTFVLSGGASLGSLQVGMLRALAEAGIAPDRIVGTSAGALNGAVLAEMGEVAAAADALAAVWASITRREVFPGGVIAQGWRVMRGRSVHPMSGLQRLIERSLTARSFAALRLPLGVLATNALTSHAHLFRAGDLVTSLLASASLPGLLPEVWIDGEPYWDGGFSANVPLLAAERLGAGSLVVLDVGDICHRTAPPEGVGETLAAAFPMAIRQRVLIEAPIVGERLPVLYLPRPCVEHHEPLSFAGATELAAATHEVVADFLAHAPVPAPGAMSGHPHDHIPTLLDPHVTLDTAGD